MGQGQLGGQLGGIVGNLLPFQAGPYTDVTTQGIIGSQLGTALGGALGNLIGGSPGTWSPYPIQSTPQYVS
jgi:hypothetical protein